MAREFCMMVKFAALARNNRPGESNANIEIAACLPLIIFEMRKMK